MSQTVTIQLEELTCPSCIRNIETAVSQLKGVIEVKVLFHSSKVKVRFEEALVSLESIRNVLIATGYAIT